MKTNIRLACAALALAFGMAVHAEDNQLLKAKVELLVEQAKGLYEDSFRKGSASYGAQYQYYFGLIYASGTNLLARADSSTTTQRLRKYFDLVEKDYETYTKIEAAADMAAATGSTRGHNGARHRAKRLINAEKLRDQELATAVKRWENFVSQLKKDPVRKAPAKKDPAGK